MAFDYLPRPDDELNVWLQQFFDHADSFWHHNSLGDPQWDAFKDALSLWQATYTAHIAARAAAESARQAKQAAREDCLAKLRPMVRLIQGFPATTDADRAGMGLTVPGATAPPGTIIASFPLPNVKAHQRLQHTIIYRDSATPDRRARPKAALGVEVWLALTDPTDPTPTDPGVYKFHSISTDGKAVADFPSNAGGKTASYLLRWIASGGVTGPWSAPATGTVAA